MRVYLLFVFLSLFVASSFGAEVVDELTSDDVCFLFAVNLRYLLKDLWTDVYKYVVSRGKTGFLIEDAIEYGKEHKTSFPEFKPLLQLLEEIRDDPKVARSTAARFQAIENILNAIILSSNWDEFYNQIVPDNIAAHIFPLVLKYILPNEDRVSLTNGNYQFSATEENAFHSVKKYKAEELSEFFEYLKEELKKIPSNNLLYLTDDPDQVKLMLLVDKNGTFNELKKLIIDSRGYFYWDRDFKTFPEDPEPKANNQLTEVVIVRGPNSKSLDPFILMVCMDVAAILAHILKFVLKYFLVK